MNSPCCALALRAEWLERELRALLQTDDITIIKVGLRVLSGLIVVYLCNDITIIKVGWGEPRGFIGGCAGGWWVGCGGGCVERLKRAITPPARPAQLNFSQPEFSMPISFDAVLGPPLGQPC